MTNVRKNYTITSVVNEENLMRVYLPYPGVTGNKIYNFNKIQMQIPTDISHKTLKNNNDVFQKSKLIFDRKETWSKETPAHRSVH